MGGHGESQAHIHSTGVPLNRRIYEAFDFGESDDFIKLLIYFGAFHAKNCAVQIDVFPPAQLRMKASAYFEQTADASVQIHPAGSRLGNARKYFEQRRF